ncbi:hypothetical protein [Aeromonas hydrophila]|uniref:hypothetical protein n=1 Tax=Aeromonas hydrophila TaxID=644 RepID=UPI00214CB562|nr:hypothetical protein [Aeromonas hydrophila]
MDEFIQEGKYASHETLKGYAYSWQTLSLLMQEVITCGMYVPELLPDENQPVLLVMIKEATVLKAKSLHSEAPEVLISIASHTGESVCSGQLNPDTWLGRFSAFAGGIPSLWRCGRRQL